MQEDSIPKFGYKSNIQESFRNFCRYYFPVCKKKSKLYRPGNENEHDLIVQIEYNDFGRFVKSFVLQDDIRKIKIVRKRYLLAMD